MSKQSIEEIIKIALQGNTQKNALEFIKHLKENDMIAGGEHGLVTYKDQRLCYMHIDNSDDMPGPWTIWTEGSFADIDNSVPMSEQEKEIAWEHVNFCSSCGGNCSPGMRKVIFGKEFEKVCNADMAFYVPDAATLEIVKKLFLMRKNYIDTNMV